MITPLRELRRWLRLRLSETRDVIGFDIAACKVIGKVSYEHKQQNFVDVESKPKDIWAGLGLGSDVAAILEGSRQKRNFKK